MTDARFERFWPRLMKYEGYATVVNDKDDSGGITKYGISKQAYPKLNIALLTEAEAQDIYWRDYYTKLRIPDITDERLAWQLFDFGVNAGVRRAAMTLQNILNVSADGAIGPKTLQAITEYKGDKPLHVLYVGARCAYYFDLAERNPRLQKFLKGWTKRANEL